MTARSLQDDAKAAGLPWTQAKGYDTFTPIRYSSSVSHRLAFLMSDSEFIPVTKVPAWEDLELWLRIDGELKQLCKTREMVHSVPALISYIR